MASLGTLIVDLVAKTGQFESDLGRAERIAKRRAANIDKALRGFGRDLAKGAAIAVTAVAALSKRSINLADDLNKLAQRTGISAESLSGIKLAADLGGSSLESFSNGVSALTRNMAAAAQEQKKQAALFGKFGIDVVDPLTGGLRNAGDVVRDVADLFARLPDGTDKAALSIMFFNKAIGPEMIPFLNGGSKGLDEFQARAERLGLVISGQTAKAAEEFNDNLEVLGLFATAVGNSIAKDLLPSLVAVTGQMTAAQEQSNAFDSIGRGIADTLRGAAAVAAVATTAIKDVTVTLAFAVQQVQNLRDITARLSPAGAVKSFVSNFGGPRFGPRKSLSEGAAGVSKDLIPDQSAAAAQLQTLKDTLRENNDALSEFLSNLFDPPQSQAATTTATDDQTEASKRLQASLRSLLSDQTAAAASQKEVEAATKSLSDILRAQSVALEDEALAAALDYRDAMTELLRIQQALTNENRLDAEATAQLAAAREGAAAALREERQRIAAEGTLALVDEAETPTDFERTRDDLQFELSLQRLTNDEREVAIALRNANVKAMSDEGVQLSELVGKLQEIEKRNAVFDDLANGATDFVIAIASGAESAKGALKSFGDFIKQTLLRQIANNLKDTLLKALGSIGGGGGGFGGIVSAIGGLFGGGRATGGPVDAGHLFRVNEREGEFFRPNGSGEVIPLSKMGSVGMGGVTQQFNFPLAFPPQLEAFVRNIAAPAGREAAERVVRAGRGRF